MTAAHIHPKCNVGQPVRVFCFINSGGGTDWVVSMAMDEFGVVAASHVSSSDAWAQHDILVRHEPDYVQRYGEGGFVLEWVAHVALHADLMRAYARNQEP